MMDPMDSQSTEQLVGNLDPAVSGLVEAALREDVGGGDVTSLWTVPDASEIGAVVVAKQPLVPSGVEIARSVFLRVDDRIDVKIHRTDGSSAEPGDTVLELRGPTRGILVAERTALNFLGRLSGIATYTRRFVDAVEAHDDSQPLFVTHTGLSGVHDHWRNIDDEQLRMVADTGGTVGVILHAAYLGKRPVTAKTVVDHLQHIVSTVGEDHASIGSDYDGSIIPPKDLPGIWALPRLVQEMLNR